MIELYSTGVTNPNTNSQPIGKLASAQPSFLGGAFKLSSSNVIGDKLIIGVLPSRATLLPSSLIVHDNLGSGVTLNVGIKEAPTNPASCLASALSVSSLSQKSGVAAISSSPSLLMRDLWEIAGFSTNPNNYLTIYATIAGANITGDPSILFQYYYVV